MCVWVGQQEGKVARSLMYRDGRWTKTMAQTGAHKDTQTETYFATLKFKCYRE